MQSEASFYIKYRCHKTIFPEDMVTSNQIYADYLAWRSSPLPPLKQRQLIAEIKKQFNGYGAHWFGTKQARGFRYLKLQDNEIACRQLSPRGVEFLKSRTQYGAPINLPNHLLTQLYLAWQTEFSDPDLFAFFPEDEYLIPTIAKSPDGIPNAYTPSELSRVLDLPINVTRRAIKAGRFQGVLHPTPKRPVVPTWAVDHYYADLTRTERLRAIDRLLATDLATERVRMAVRHAVVGPRHEWRTCLARAIPLIPLQSAATQRAAKLAKKLIDIDFDDQ